MMKQIIQKYSLIAGIVVAATSFPVRVQAAESPSNLGHNIVQNGSFEDGDADWEIEENMAQVVADVAHSGKHSLHYENSDPKRYKTFTQSLDVKPGQHVLFSAWIKGENTDSSELGKSNITQGAGVYIQSYAGSKYLGGSFPTRRGTFDWTLIKGEYVVPPTATKISIGVYLRKDTTGAAWFDDVEVRAILPPAVKSFLQYPNYRGMATANDNTPWKYQLHINKQADWGNGALQIINTLTDSGGKVLLTKTAAIDSSKKDAEITFTPPRNLPLGKYTLMQQINSPQGDSILRYSNTIEIAAQMPKTYIDAQGFTVVNGKRFFPMGVYLGPTSETDLQRISDGGFNTILAYGYGVGKEPEAFMDRAAKYHLNVVYSLKDLYPGHRGYGESVFEKATDYLKMMRDRPNLLAWYTNDELGPEWSGKLHTMYDLVKQLDPNHPAFQVLYQIDILDRYFDVTDVLGTDPYPVGNADLTKTSNSTRLAATAAHRAKGTWIVPQIMDNAVYKKDREPHPPSLDEMRNQAYQAIINGATGLIWYSYYDMMYEKYPRDNSTKDMDLFQKRWKDVSAMAGEINKITPVVLENKKVLLDIPIKPDVEAAAWQNGDNLLIVLANPYYAEKSITFALPAGWKISDADQGQIKSTFVDGKATFTLASVGSGVFRLVKK